jgi:hypothetical protein
VIDQDLLKLFHVVVYTPRLVGFKSPEIQLALSFRLSVRCILKVIIEKDAIVQLMVTLAIQQWKERSLGPVNFRRIVYLGAMNGSILSQEEELFICTSRYL